jgi:hypothetical protein
MPTQKVAGSTAEIAETAASVLFRVAVQRFAPVPASRNAQAVLVSRHGSEIEDC